ncbi:C-C motif chemokine 18-like [Astyanax mexicanus]|uniref:C-C motif chemokine 18-like n=1 Tax=Astyanax mexicanus TaxID=7994 RepID=A0A8T2LMG8_ASTMX|nr:C-C motif chemokine 18-like [Astyanax mexicanus]
MKKISCVCAALGLVLLIAVSSVSSIGGSNHPTLCCFHFVKFKIPLKNILTVEKTNKACPVPGYVVTTPRGKFCKQEDVLLD